MSLKPLFLKVMNTAHDILDELAEQAIERLRQLPQPVVRVSGPLTSGGFGYEKNLQRFIKAQQVLRDKGFTVYDYFEDNDDETVIKNLGVSWEEVMRHYHAPILATGLISTMYLMPRWEESNGANWEHEYFVKNKLATENIPEAWLA